jgi:hypothetical protein
MFVFHCTGREDAPFDAHISMVDRDYPKESFDISDPDNGPIESVLYYCCAIIQESGAYRFAISGVGLDLTLPVKPEMCILLEQLEGLVCFLRSDSQPSIAVRFFEQGCRITMFLSRSITGIDVRIELHDEERVVEGEMGLEALRVQTSRFLLGFLQAVATLIPAMLAEPAFVKWFGAVAITSSDRSTKV